MTIKNAIFLDFDGVLSNSVKEAYLLSRYAFKNIDVYCDIEKELYQKFIDNRYVVQNSWQYYYLIKYCYENNNSLLNSLKQNEITDKFNEKFLSKRKELMRDDLVFWNSLDEKTNFLEKIEDVIKMENVFILSTKNKEAIALKFDFWNIEYNLSNIIGKSEILNYSKGDFIEEFVQEKNINNAILIDDIEENITSCNDKKNISAYLTLWGYGKSSLKSYKEEEIEKIIREKI